MGSFGLGRFRAALGAQTTRDRASSTHAGEPGHGQKVTWALVIGSLGVVYGDIGTSPLYAMSEIFFGHFPLERNQANVLGVVSMVFWALVLIVFIKYVALILRADNNGEGGIFALLGLLLKQEQTDAQAQTHTKPSWARRAILPAILVGAALLYGDGVITPSISVLSAVEGLSIVTPAAKPFEVPISVAILVVLFAIQKWGTHRIGGLFGPVMLVWFICLAILGVLAIREHPEVIAGLNPWYAIAFAKHHGAKVFFVLGSVVLCVTGVEAMYADLGHFGRSVIVRSWSLWVFPCLVLNYLGQGAHVLSGAPVPENHLFYALAPKGLLLPMVVLATVATVIASQALISGAFSLTQQAIAMGLFPRLRIVHTNPNVPGQIYVPAVNFAIAVACVWLVVSFKHSADLAAAYGVAVTGTMVMTVLAFALVATTVFGWRKRLLLPLLVPLLAVDLAFFTSTLLKFTSGGYVSVLIGVCVFVVMDTWRWGRRRVGQAYQTRLTQEQMTVQDLLAAKPKYHIEGLPSVSMVVMASKPIEQLSDSVPPVLMVHYANWRRLPKHIIFLSIMQTGRPIEPSQDRYRVVTFERNDRGTVVAVQAYFGYMEQPDIRAALLELKKKQMVKIPLSPKRWLVLVGTERFVTPGKGYGQRLRMGLFSRMNRLAKPAIDYFGLETDSAVVMETINV